MSFLTPPAPATPGRAFFDDSEMTRVEQFTLRQRKLHCARTIHERELFDNPKLKELIHENLLYEFDAYAEGYEGVSIPNGPWQWLKQRHAPKWFKKRWPVKWLTMKASLFVPQEFMDRTGCHPRFVNDTIWEVRKDG
jgi:hypothetical protein